MPTALHAFAELLAEMVLAASSPSAEADTDAA